MSQSHQDQLNRIKAEIADSFDEELEMQMEEDRLSEDAGHNAGNTIDAAPARSGRAARPSGIRAD